MATNVVSVGNNTGCPVWAAKPIVQSKKTTKNRGEYFSIIAKITFETQILLPDQDLNGFEGWKDKKTDC
jgi:hypothetical protein